MKTLAVFLALSAAGSAANSDDAAEPVEIIRFKADEAQQGVAADRRHVYVNANSAIGKYDKRSGKKVASWSGDPALFIHMNSCAVVAAKLVCAASNYPQVPMASSVETFDTRTLRHVSSRSLGPGKGSLTWLDWHRGQWWAMFAHYDGKGGEAGRDHRHTVLVRYDRNFVEQQSWLLPMSVLARLAPYSSSGGSWSSDGLLYITGHDRRELYVLQLPKAGSTLRHVATLPMATPGQAIDWDPTEERLLWSIERPTSEVVAARIGPVAGASKE